MAGRATRRLLPALLAGLLIAAAVRLYRIDAQSLWNDEGNSLRLAERSLGALIDAAARDIHPPGYYLALKGWIALAGTSELALRLPSALAGLLTVAVASALGRRLSETGAGALAGLLVALSPLAVYYSQETRMYALLGLLAALSMAVFAAWLERITRGRSAGRWAVALGLINAAGLYTHYAFPFTLLAQGALLALWLAGRAQRRDWLTARHGLLGYIALSGLALALFTPWLPTAWDQLTGWPAAPHGVSLVERLRASLGAITTGGVTRDAPWAALIAPGLLALGGLFGGRRLCALPHGWRALLPPVWAAATVGGLLLSGAYRPANLKFLVPAQVAAALWLAGGAAGWWTLAARSPRAGLPRIAGRVLVLALAGITLAGQVRTLDTLAHDPAAARADYRAIAARLAQDARPGDAILLDAPNQAEVFSYYYDGPAPVIGLPRGLGGDDAQTRAEVEALLARHTRVFALFWGEDERDPRRVVQAALDAGAFPVGSTWYGDVRLAQYAVLAPPPAAPQTSLRVHFGESMVLTGYALSAPALRPGEALGVTLFWQASASLSVRYKVTVQVIAPDGALIAQHDAEPDNNRALTSGWTPGETVIDPHGLIIPPQTAPGVYRVAAGVYPIDAPAQRLSPSDPSAASDLLPLAQVRIEAAP